MANKDQTQLQEAQKNISAVIPTYNRSPYEDVKHNPPWWAAHSLRMQGRIGEIVFIDDASNDYTKKTIDKIKEEMPELDIVYIKNQENKGLSASRNIGVRKAKHDKIWFMDDDCIMVSPTIINKIDKAYNLLEEEGNNIGAISLPVTENSLNEMVVPANQIGTVDKRTGLLNHCNTKFPKEYEENPSKHLIDEEDMLFRPLLIEFSHAVFLMNKEAFNYVGGFEVLPWKTELTEESRFLQRLWRNGYNVYYMPSKDPSFRVFHCKFGDPSFKRIPYDLEIKGMSFNEILRRSSIGREDQTGLRTKKEKEFYFDVIAEMCFVFEFEGADTGIRHLNSKYKLAMENKNFPQAENKKEIFRKALYDGIKNLSFSMDKEKINYLISNY